MGTPIPTLKEVPLSQHLASLIRQHRKAYNLTQSELAGRVSATQGFIARLEAGRANPTLKSLENIAQAFGLRIQIRFIRQLQKPGK